MLLSESLLVLVGIVLGLYLGEIFTRTPHCRNFPCTPPVSLTSLGADQGYKEAGENLCLSFSLSFLIFSFPSFLHPLFTSFLFFYYINVFLHVHNKMLFLSIYHLATSQEFINK